jgi:hypothetical protein
MNIYEDADLEQKLSQLSDQLGLLVLDLLLESIKKISAENLIRIEWQECKLPPKKENPEF